MTPKDLTAARVRIGEMWRLGGPLTAADLGRLLHIARRDPGAQVRNWETGKAKEGVPGPVRAYVEALLAGYIPPGAPEGRAPMDAAPAQNAPARNRRRA